ncbi:MAG: hypothetical protein M1445_08525 [Bacteroidetes bacterium]|nr:hypothetical protein [Bacteroidota bacterium]
MKNIFVDFHHSDLFYSFVLLFEKRFGWNVFRPIGLDWFDAGYWKIAEPYGNSQDTINQYLAINDKSWNAYSNLNGWTPPKDNYIKDGIYYCYDPVHDYHHKAITFEMFKTMPIDYIISSIPAHDLAYARLRNEVKSGAKHISHVGNIGQSSTYPNIMCAASHLNGVPYDSNIIYYHQEFDLNVYKYVKPEPTKKVRCFMNVLPFTPDYPLYQEFKRRMPDFDFKSYGGSCEDGSLHNQWSIAEKMSESQFIWHIKHTGDGFGHVIHNAAACGRPLITKKGYYSGQLAEALMIDQETCITIDGKTNDQIEAEIRKWSNPENHKKMCENMYKKFKEIVDYDKESEAIKGFLEKCR